MIIQRGSKVAPHTSATSFSTSKLIPSSAMGFDMPSLPECSLTWSSSTKGMSSLLQNFPWSLWLGIANQGHSVTQHSQPVSPECLSHWTAPVTSVSAESCNYSWRKMLSAWSWCSGLLRYILAVPTSGWNFTVSSPWRGILQFYGISLRILSRIIF